MAHSLAWILPLLWVLVLLPRGTHNFFPNFWSKVISFSWGSRTHQDITEEAILNVTLELLLDMPHPLGKTLKKEDFVGRTLVPDDLLRAYRGAKASPKPFRAALMEVVNANAAMDFLSSTRNNAALHFDSENIRTANQWLLLTRKEILQAARAENYEVARERLGCLLHSLQDFYSHSNWIEMGYRKAHPDLVTVGKDISSIADAQEHTCSDCSEWTCRDNILPSLNKRRRLTTGYYGSHPKKPLGKCSHGGYFDDSVKDSATGGINKDSKSEIFSPHHYLHAEAARIAKEASVKFLRELRIHLGDKHFLRLLGLGSGSGLSFVIDTTGSMGEEITAARLQTRSIIDQRRNTPEEPDFYILVPFHDPDFGPVYKTRNPDVFWDMLSNLTALGGGDEPEMSLSAIQLALLNTPPHSEIFVFTDASSKDAELANSVESLIQERKSKVSFLITEDPSRAPGRGRREVLSPHRFDLYASLAQKSGGEIIFTNNHDIREVSSIIQDSTNSGMITLFHVQKKEPGPRDWKTYNFHLDSLLERVKIHIHGDIDDFQIIGPTGKRQGRSMTTGPLGVIQNVGRFSKMSLKSPVHVGHWKVEILTQGIHTVHVQGESTLDFLHYFAVSVNGSHPGLFQLSSQPVTGTGLDTMLVVMATGLAPASPARLDLVTLAGPDGEVLDRLALQDTNQTGLYVAELGKVPSGAFSILVSGRDGENRPLLRSSPQVNTVVESTLEIISSTSLIPGSQHSALLRLTNYGTPADFTLKLNCEQACTVNSSHSRAHVGRNETVTGEISVLVSQDTEPGSTVLLTVQADSADAAQTTFAFLQLMVTESPKHIRTSPTTCSVISLEHNCSGLPSHCGHELWTVAARVWDTVGVQIASGRGTVSYSSEGSMGRAVYTADCCSPETDLVFTNQLGGTSLCRLGVAVPSPASSSVGDLPLPRWTLLTLLLIMFWRVLKA
ncbi:von Willebrand factor A domain-containing protein 7 isoform X2 [Microcaecilia unicolor]|nr:von Willebrand factor A domain-containing protein 7 isoform X2 [Microcaecilia unicolor]XP_030053295.1 von Willebrand factor A domain-containing protein 7 isoform X2 [Microcaecilia unicolor]XP_030053297.1 von Willebrand factor A domain-containing protein 7 isoform X2 [Microcaecilia unicolor]XP_030053298.1 von Willebrand factor A domain-containing protein 7 isoform X2 [Microcaecilia unicolor]